MAWPAAPVPKTRPGRTSAKPERRVACLRVSKPMTARVIAKRPGTGRATAEATAHGHKTPRPSRTDPIAGATTVIFALFAVGMQYSLPPAFTTRDAGAAHASKGLGEKHSEAHPVGLSPHIQAFIRRIDAR